MILRFATDLLPSFLYRVLNNDFAIIIRSFNFMYAQWSIYHVTYVQMIHNKCHVSQQYGALDEVRLCKILAISVHNKVTYCEIGERWGQ